MCGCHAIQSLVTEVQVARRLGVSPGELSRLRAEAGFPEPRGEIESSSPPLVRVPFWLWADVVAWTRVQHAAAA